MRMVALLAAVAGAALLGSAMLTPTAAQRPDPRTPCPPTLVKIDGKCQCPRGTAWNGKLCGPSTATPPCPPTQVKIDGRCQCPPGTAKNGERCVPSTAAPPSCPPTQVKIDGRCQCPAGTAKNGERCVSSTPSCPPTQALINGQCQCPTGTTWTGQSCGSSTATGGDCPPTQVKINGQCQCPIGKTWAGQSCVAPLVITTASLLPPAAQGQPYSQSLAATGGTAAYTWSLVGTPPAWLTLSSAGVLSGTPAFGIYSLTVAVNDATPGTPLTTTKTFALEIKRVLVTTPSLLPPATQWQSYSQTLTATGGTAPYTWYLIGNLPAGLTLSLAGVLSGMPTASGGSFSFGVTVKDATPGTPLSGSKTFLLSVPYSNPLVITTASGLPPATQGQSYSQTLMATGGNAPYTWSVVGATMLAGLTLSSTGVLSGAPTAAYEFGSPVVKVTDTTPGTPLTATKTFLLPVAETLVITTPLQLPPAMQGQSYSHTLTANGGLPPYTWSKTGVGVPAPWLQLSPLGVLSATPTGPSQFGFGVRVTDSTPGTPLTTTKNLSWDAYSNEVPILITTPSALWHATKGQSYSKTLTAVGGTAPYTWSVPAGTSLCGLTLSATGVLSGAPTATGSYSPTVKVQDASPGTPLTATKIFALNCVLPVAITTSALPPLMKGQPYSQTLTATGGIPPYTWSAPYGRPQWLTLSPSGVLSGTPPVDWSGSPSWLLTLKANDALDGSATKNIPVSVQ